MLELLESPGDPFARDRFDPGHFTASAFVLAPDTDDLLMIRHARLERWLQPGGHVDPGDADLTAAARREVREETGLEDLSAVPGLDAPLDLDVHAIPARSDQPRHLHLDVRFAFRAAARALTPATDAKAAAWVGAAEATRLNREPAMRRVLDKLTVRSFEASRGES